MVLFCAIWAALVWPMLSCVCSEAHAGELPPQISEIEDPRSLRFLAENALAAGQTEDARNLFGAMLDRMEVQHYLEYRDNLREALILERLGENARAASRYREAMGDDLLRAVLVLRILSVHPDRDALVAEAYSRLDRLVADARLGQKNEAFYVTKSGAPRYLEPWTQEDWLELQRAGKPLDASYCYLESLDLTGVEDLPPVLHLEKCVVDRIRVSNRQLGRLVLKGFVRGDLVLGKTWEGEPEKSKTIAASTFDDLVLRESVILGRANLSGIAVHGGRAYFPLVVFEGEADFRGAELEGVTEFRFASFGSGANFKKLRMHGPVYFGGSRFRDEVVFTGLWSVRDVHFNSTQFDGRVDFDHCEWQKSATFEDSRFFGPANFESTRVGDRLNLSRTEFAKPLQIREVEAGGLDAFGAQFLDDVFFTDATFHGRVRFSLDGVTRRAFENDLDGLLPLYRDYQGDEDADKPLTTKTSYGVKTLDHLTARIHKGIHFANTQFEGYTVFEGVTFGTAGEPSVASFYNAQLLGETHFERTDWLSEADFTTMFGKEIAFNEARFERSLILDDAYVEGRLALTDAAFGPEGNLSFYGSEIRSFQVDPDQIDGGFRRHRLFYEGCALREPVRSDVRLGRVLLQTPEITDHELERLCFDRLSDEWVSLKEAYGNEAMVEAEDDAYWWYRHHGALAALHTGGVWDKLTALLVDLFVFELCFGWGVNLANLGVAGFVTAWVFSLLYRYLCANTVLQYDGEEMRIRDVSFSGLFYVSLQSLVAINTGWDIGDDNHRFRFLNTCESLTGVIILTFFVGAYTRMILA